MPGYFGGYFGMVAPAEDEAGSGSSSPPIPAPLTVSDPEYVDHASRMVDRLPQYAKRRAD